MNQKVIAFPRSTLKRCLMDNIRSEGCKSKCEGAATRARRMLEVASLGCEVGLLSITPLRQFTHICASLKHKPPIKMANGELLKYRSRSVSIASTCPALGGAHKHCADVMMPTPRHPTLY